MVQARQKRSQEKRLISPAFSAFLKSRIKEIIGLILLLCGFVFFLALFSYNPADNSVNIAAYGPSKNMIGPIGAYLADSFLQWFGLAAYFIAMALCVYGLHFIRNMRFVGFLKLRFMLILPSLLGLSALLAWLTPSKPHSEPFVNKGYGGVMGDILALFLSGSTSLFSSFITLAIFILVALLSFIVVTYALILPFDFWSRSFMRILSGMQFIFHSVKKEKTEEDLEEEKPSIIVSKAGADNAQDTAAKPSLFSKLMNKQAKEKQAKEKQDREEVNHDEARLASPPPLREEEPRILSKPAVYTASKPSLPEDDEDLHITPASQVEDDFDEDEDDLIFEPSYEPSVSQSVSMAPQAVVKTPMSEKPKIEPKEEPANKEQPKGQDNMVIKPNPSYRFPSLNMLDKAPPKADQDPEQIKKLEENAKNLEQTLSEFGVKGKIVSVRPGPVVTLYELEPAPGTRTSRVVGLSDDIARQMLVASVRVAPVAGKNVIGIEMPNEKRETVWLRTLFEHESFRKAKGKLAMALGENIGGDPMVVDLAKMPHLLIAGTTGSGKSVAVNTMILSLLYRLKPEECRLIMIDPKMLELSVYENIPHLLTPVVTDPMKAVVSLKWAVREMDDRYRKMAKMGVRNIAGYNSRIKEALAKGETLTKDIQTGFDDNGRPITESVPLDMDTMPYIVILIDEVADLMMMGGKQDIEIAVQRLAQKARAAGIHVIMATQRPSVDVITGTIKANFPTRISFAVTSRIDSRTILGEQGAEQLLGMGDMLYMAGGGKTERAHGPFVSDEEVEEIANHIRSQGQPQYVSAVLEEVNEDGSPMESAAVGDGGEKDVLYDQALAIILREKKASTSFIQRQLAIGYNRAARIIDQLEAEGIISPADRVGRRTVIAEDHTGMDIDD